MLVAVRAYICSTFVQLVDLLGEFGVVRFDFLMRDSSLLSNRQGELTTPSPMEDPVDWTFFLEALGFTSCSDPYASMTWTAKVQAVPM